jgi:Concanavalin A-like lectin/glucanases superfamily
MPPVYPAGSYPALVVADGASAFWRLGETSGLTAVDVIGGANGTISGGVTLGQAGALADGDKSMLFDGTTGRTFVPTGAYETIGTGPLTVECWMRLIQVTGQRSVVDAKNATGTTSPGFSVLHDTTEVYFWLRGPGGQTSYAAASIVAAAMADGQWRHVVGVLGRGSPDTVDIYINGTLRNDLRNVAASGVDYSSTLGLGLGAAVTDPQFYAGSLDEVAIYPTALTAPQIAAHYAAKDWTASTFGPGFSKLEYRWCRYVPRRARR